MASMKDRLAQALRESGHEPMDLVRAIKKSKATVYWILDGKTKAETVRAATVFSICDWLKINPRWLLAGKGPMRDESVKLQPASQSQPVKLDPSKMLAALRYLERRAAEAGRRYDPFTDADLLCWAYEIEANDVAPPSNVIDFGRELLKRFARGERQDAKGGTG